MGAVQVTVTVRNPADPDRSWDGLFLVDTGSTDCVVPGSALRSIGLLPRGQRTYELADGREETVDVVPAEIEFMGEIVGTTICFGNDGIEPLLGLTPLESVGIEIDPVSQRLKRRPAVPMKRRLGRPGSPSSIPSVARAMPSMLDSIRPTCDTIDRVADDTDPARAMPTPTIGSSSVIVRLLDAALPWWLLFAAPGVPSFLWAGAPWVAGFLAASVLGAVVFYNMPWPRTHSDQTSTSST